MRKLTIYTDGGARNNGQPNAIGAFAVVALKGEDEIVAVSTKTKIGTTNNEMELYGLHTSIELSLRLLKSGAYDEVLIHSDSMYALNIVEDWMWKWEQRGWTKPKGEIKNLDIIKEMYQMLHREDLAKKIKFKHVKGHSGVVFNELADQYLNQAMDAEEKKI